MVEAVFTGVRQGMDIKFKATILIVDSESDNLVLMKEQLQGRYHAKLARTGADALRLARLAPRPDLILIDAALPEMDASAVLRELRGDFLSEGTAVIFLTAADDADAERRAFRDGATDVIARPITGEALKARVALHLELKALRAMQQDRDSQLDYLVAERTREAVCMQDATIMAMATLAESRDTNTGNHLRRTQLFFTVLARELRFHSRFSGELTDASIALMSKAAPLHDIGKVAVPDAILMKPGRLTPDEFNLMKQHTVHGRDAIAGVEKTLGGTNPFLRYAREITYSHQEKWDGSGYPDGLRGEYIPLSARLMAVADVYDALISKRVYKPAFTHETAVELIRQSRGEHFDPDIVDAMLVVEEQFRAIAAEFPDAE
jgi:putative two-component system response regulator